MKYAAIAVFAVLAGLPAFGQQLPVSGKYPLQAHIVSVESQQEQYLQDGTGGTYERHLMRTEINGKVYGLRDDTPISIRHRAERWLHTGFYPARATKNGFELEYVDVGGKLRHGGFSIVSEE
ncbi:MAG: hypothetical protein LAN36_12660 [Acidobacteriia bacterium]|nr:hypothetical protein [Terriglobia bacterium]